jgi:hypothetical protein
VAWFIFILGRLIVQGVGHLVLQKIGNIFRKIGNY